MRLKDYTLLKESLTSAKKKYLNTEKITSDSFDKLVEGDPSKTKKYLEWMCKQISEITFTTPFELIGYIQKFDKAIKTKYPLPSKDINYYQTLEELIENLRNFDNYLLTTRKSRKLKGAKKIFENDKCVVYYIKTKEACQIYGANTKWCITEKNKPYWEQYNTENIFLFLLDKNDPDRKYAIVLNLDELLNHTLNLQNIQIFKADDNPLIDYSSIIKLFGYYDVSFYTDLIAFTETQSFISKLKKEKEAQFFKNAGITKNNDGTYNIKNYLRTTDATLSYLFDKDENGNYTKLKIKFKIAENSVNFGGEVKLVNLEGFPDIVKGSFIIESVPTLRSLKGGPKFVKQGYSCYLNPLLKTLEGAPKKVGGQCDFAENHSLESLKGAPKEINGAFLCWNNPSLKSLEGIKDMVGVKSVDASRNERLQTIKEAPKQLNSLQIYECPKLKDLKGLQDTIIMGDLNCNDCNMLETFEGAPKKVGLTFTCRSQGNTVLRNLKGLENTKLHNLNIDLGGLESLEGCPTEISGSFNIAGKLKNLKHFPKIVSGDRVSITFNQNKYSTIYISLKDLYDVNIVNGELILKGNLNVSPEELQAYFEKAKYPCDHIYIHSAFYKNPNL